MMEKPLAVSNADAQRIRQAAAAGGIQVLVNYETTWYPSHGAMWTLLKEQKAGGEIRKMVAMDGHSGPKAINVSRNSSTGCRIRSGTAPARCSTSAATAPT